MNQSFDTGLLRNNKHILILFRTFEDLDWLQPGFLEKVNCFDFISEFTVSSSRTLCFDFGFGLQYVSFYKLPELTSLSVLRKEMGLFFQSLDNQLRGDVSLCLPHVCYEHDLFLLGQVISEAFVLSTYSYLYKDDMPKHSFDSCELYLQTNIENELFLKGAVTGETIARNVNKARNLCNSPSNLLKPTDFVAITQKEFAKSVVNVSVIDEQKAHELGMNAFLGVGKGSSEPSFMLCLEYNLNDEDLPITLVGKGVTFDSGGISLKPSKNMAEMKADMSGAACVLYALKAIVELGLNKSVRVIIPLVENMPSGNALKPGDVIGAMNGKSIEILNTDAEGRLILADALCLAVEKKSKMIIDIATLTGACVVALGTEATGMFSNSDSMIETFKKVSSFTGDKVWQLPLYDCFLDYLKSDVADIANCSEGRHGGASTAAKFLQQFVKDTPWLHLDMAPVMSKSKADGLCSKGMSAEGVRNLIAFVQHS